MVTESPSERLGQNIKRIREKKGMTQGDLCRACELDRAYVSNLEAGKKNPTLATIGRVATVLKVEMKELVT
jgi:transcriptional regulator with XRE-family HTH domain